MYPAYYDNWDPYTPAPANLEKVRRFLDRASGEKETDNLIVRFLRAGVPIHIGNKSEPVLGSWGYEKFFEALKIVDDYGYDVWLETKTGSFSDPFMVNELRKFNNDICVGISIIPGGEKLREKLEPEASSNYDRWIGLKDLRNVGIKAGVKAEPIMMNINDSDEDITKFFMEIEAANGMWLTFFNYKTKRRPMAREFFEQEGLDYDRMYSDNQDDTKWRKCGERLYELHKRGQYAFRLTTADIFTFPLEVRGTCCCGFDLTNFSRCNFQSAARTLQDKGSVQWSDVYPTIKDVLPDKELNRFKALFHHPSDEHYTFYDCPELIMENGSWRKRQKSEYPGWGQFL
jgi:DNA repair photolyase